jgi:WD40 repeat protein
VLASRDLGVVGGPVGGGAPGEHDFAPLRCFLNYAPDGSFLVVTDVSARLRSGVIFSLDDARAELRFIAADDLREFRRIDLDLSGYSQAYGPVQIQLSPAGDRLALALSPLGGGSELVLPGDCQEFRGTEVRVYEVKTARLVWTATFSGARGEGVAWSPDGLKLALTLPSTRGDRWFSTRCPQHEADNLLILESSSGRVLTSISTGDLPGPVCFGPHDEVFTAPIHFYVRGGKDEQVRVWNAQTGMLARTIGLRGRAVHNQLALSRDGKVLVGYVGKEKFGFSLLEDVQEILDQRFAVWDAATGGLIALSQDFIPRLSGRRGSGFQGLDLRMHLAADGRSLLAEWDWAPAPLLLFELPDTRVALPR